MPPAPFNNCRPPPLPSTSTSTLSCRDLKASNLLIDGNGRLAICDFGLARKYGSPLRAFTETVVTQWYRSPELLLGARTYSTAVDVWSVGCIFGELLLRKPLFPGKSEGEQIELIFRALGTPSDDNWPAWTQLPRARDLRMRPRATPPMRTALGLPGSGPGAGGAGAGGTFISDSGLDLLRRLLALDPSRRISAADALSHPWFGESPLPTDPRLLPALPIDDDDGGVGAGSHSSSAVGSTASSAAGAGAGDPSTARRVAGGAGAAAAVRAAGAALGR